MKQKEEMWWDIRISNVCGERKEYEDDNTDWHLAITIDNCEI